MSIPTLAGTATVGSPLAQAAVLPGLDNLGTSFLARDPRQTLTLPIALALFGLGVILASGGSIGDMATYRGVRSRLAAKGKAAK